MCVGGGREKCQPIWHASSSRDRHRVETGSSSHVLCPAQSTVHFTPSSLSVIQRDRRPAYCRRAALTALAASLIAADQRWSAAPEARSSSRRQRSFNTSDGLAPISCSPPAVDSSVTSPVRGIARRSGRHCRRPRLLNWVSNKPSFFKRFLQKLR